MTVPPPSCGLPGPFRCVLARAMSVLCFSFVRVLPTTRNNRADVTRPSTLVQFATHSEIVNIVCISRLCG